MQKIGVFVCWCGSNIAGTVDVAQVVEAVRQVPDVAYAVDYKYMCSEQGQEIIRNAVPRVCTKPPSASARKAWESTHTWWKLPISVSNAPGY